MTRLLVAALAVSVGAAALVGCAMEPNAGRYPPPAVSSEEAGNGDAARAAIAEAVSDASRPQADRDRDAARHPAEILAFARVAPGQRIADLWPGGGYFTRLFARATGREGRVYAFTPTEQPARYADAILPLVNDTGGYPNVQRVALSQGAFATPERLDLVFTNQNYHDFHNLPGADVAGFNRAVFAALRPGGLYVIADHSAPEGAPLTTTNTTHRIDPAQVRREVEAAGFVYAGESQVLRNSADPRTVNVFDEAIRGRTDQFVMRFRRPLS